MFHLTAADLLRGSKVFLRPPRPEELAFVRTLWGAPETMAPVGDAVAPGNRPGQRLLEAFGFTRDDTVPELCRMVLTQARYRAGSDSRGQRPSER